MSDRHHVTPDMKPVIFALAASAFALPNPQPVQLSNIVLNTDLIPDFGVTSGIPSTTQLGSCQGADDTNIPCQCPPNLDVFITRLEQFVDAGNAFGIPVTFPTDDSIQSQLDRVDACISTLQNIDNIALGEGCPIAAAPNFSAQQATLLQQL
jgi:hypothetical protein